MCDKMTTIYMVKMPECADAGNKKREHAAGKLLLGYGLMEMFGLKLQDGMLARSPSGKPYLPACPDIHFNISHSGDYVVCAVGSEPLGVDIERHRAIAYRRLARKIFSEDEWTKVEACTDLQQFFFDRWVEKESCLKWKGTGITRDLRSLDLSEGWGCHFYLSEGYSGAVWSGEPLKIKLHVIDYREL